MSRALIEQAELEQAQGLGFWGGIASAVLGVGGGLFAASEAKKAAKEAAKQTKMQIKAAEKLQSEAQKAAEAQMVYQARWEAQQADVANARQQRFLDYATVGGIVLAGVVLAGVIFVAARPKKVVTK